MPDAADAADGVSATACPAGFYSAAGAQVCAPASPTVGAATADGTAQSGLDTCSGSYTSVGGTACEACSDGWEQCTVEHHGQNVSCKPGFKYDYATDQKGCVAPTEGAKAATLDSLEAECPRGFMRRLGMNTELDGGLRDDDVAYQCLECPDTQVCLLLEG